MTFRSKSYLGKLKIVRYIQLGTALYLVITPPLSDYLCSLPRTIQPLQLRLCTCSDLRQHWKLLWCKERKQHLSYIELAEVTGIREGVQIICTMGTGSREFSGKTGVEVLTHNVLLVLSPFVFFRGPLRTSTSHFPSSYIHVLTLQDVINERNPRSKMFDEVNRHRYSRCHLANCNKNFINPFFYLPTPLSPST